MNGSWIELRQGILVTTVFFATLIGLESPTEILKELVVQFRLVQSGGRVGSRREDSPRDSRVFGTSLTQGPPRHDFRSMTLRTMRVRLKGLQPTLDPSQRSQACQTAGHVSLKKKRSTVFSRLLLEVWQQESVFRGG